MNFFARVYAQVNKIPAGQVASYGQIASLLGSPRAGRVVGLALSKLPSHSPIPWQRVVNKHGMLSIENLAVPKEYQKKLLEKEGIIIKKVAGNYFVSQKTKYYSPGPRY